MGRFIGRILMPWVRFNLRPQDVAQQQGATDLQVCYVIERDSALDEAVLQRACARAKLPRPGKRLAAGDEKLGESLLALARKVGVWRTRLDRRTPALLRVLLEQARRDASFDVLLVPVSVYFGRSPQRESGSWLRLMLSENWALASRIRRLLAVMLNGRNTLVEFGTGVPLRSLLSNDARSTSQRAASRVTCARSWLHRARRTSAGSFAPAHAHDAGAAHAGRAHAGGAADAGAQHSATQGT